jgi:hypothetical protein
MVFARNGGFVHFVGIWHLAFDIWLRGRAGAGSRARAKAGAGTGARASSRITDLSMRAVRVGVNPVRGLEC